MCHLGPEILVEGAGDHASFEQELNPPLVSLGDLKVEVVSPVLQLEPLQRLHVEIRSLYLVMV